MKTIIISIALSISAFLTNAQEQLTTQVEETGTTITVTVPINTTNGLIIAGLYNEGTFMKAAPLQGQESKIVDGKATLTFTNVAPGSYGITLFHDKNGNKQMDFEPSGMPKEMYGASNNVMNFGPPQWSDAKFEVASEPIEMEVRL